MTKIGFLGLGIMGCSVAWHLQKGGRDMFSPREIGVSLTNTTAALEAFKALDRLADHEVA